ncbi:glycosyltransferase family 4 protein [Mycolicibacterium cosmeticum]|uniref:glycosyltransferase family 4 protein n=1 Tax=Mycolicibacterium cosmeticum TaxID=258533 RepID=UPI00320485CA
MNIVIHDFAGHPGQLQLSRELAARGHTVAHQYCASVTTGRGATSIQPGDPPTLSIEGISLGGEFARYAAGRRGAQELRYGWLSARAVLRSRPDVAVFANFPTIPLYIVSLVLKAGRIPFVFWWQDIHSEAVSVIARRRFGRVGAVIAWGVERLERRIAHRASRIVPISDAFLARLTAWRVDPAKVVVIPNWGALNEVPQRPRANPWSARYGLDDVQVVMYAGTLGLKHDPAVVAELLHSIPDDCRIVVVSEGIGREWLEKHCGGDEKLMLMDYRPYAELPDMLASADVLLGILERDASRFSVPSKILNYLCAGRPVLAVLPQDNAIASMVRTADAGLVTPPGDYAAAATALKQLLTDPVLRRTLGRNGRQYAQRSFDIVEIGDRFERLLKSAKTPAAHAEAAAHQAGYPPAR